MSLRNPFSKEYRPLDEDGSPHSDGRFLSVEDRRRLRGRSMDHSLTFAILLYVNIFYFGLYACAELGLILFKAYNVADARLRYTPSMLLSELFVLAFLAVVESYRLFLGQKHELDGFDKSLANVFRILTLTAPSMYTVLYFTAYQHLVLRIESVLGAIMLIIQASQFISAFFNLWPRFSTRQP